MTRNDNSNTSRDDVDNDNSNTGRDDVDVDVDVDLGRVWAGVAAEVWRRHPGPVERLAGRLLRSPGLARALVTTPSLMVPWLISTAVVFGVGGMISLTGGVPLVWLLAPGIAALGIAYAYGPGIDPAWELACSMAVSDRMVLLVRAVAVFAVNAILGLAASGISYSAAASGGVGHATAAQAATITFAWLLPMTAICALTLAVAVASRSAGLGAAAGIAAWAATVLASQAASGYTAAVTDSKAYLPYLAVAACATAVIGYATRTHRGAQ